MDNFVKILLDEDTYSAVTKFLRPLCRGYPHCMPVGPYIIYTSVNKTRIVYYTLQRFTDANTKYTGRGRTARNLKNIYQWPAGTRAKAYHMYIKYI
jgi:hypothetical protein